MPLRRHVLQQRLGELAARLEGLQRSFECIQDCVRAYSPRLWHQEFAAFVRCAFLPKARVWTMRLVMLRAWCEVGLSEV